MRSPRGSAFEPGGDVGALQLELERRLLSPADGQALQDAEPPVERLIRTLSVTAGYASLMAGLVLVALALL